MAAASSSPSFSKSDLRSRVAEIAQCPICLDDYKNPRSLPCQHVFCKQCLQDIWKDNRVGDTVLCPVCREGFVIPSKGLDELPHNFFLQNLIDAKEATSDQPGEVLCEACVEDSKDSAENIPPATMYCVDCNQKLCNRCSRPHRAMRGGPHQVKELGTELTVELIQQRGSYCEKHTDKRLEMYCFTCNMNACLSCCIVTHPQPEHVCKEIVEVAKDFGNNMDSDVQAILSRVDVFRAGIRQTDDEDHRFQSTITSLRREPRSRNHMQP